MRKSVVPLCIQPSLLQRREAVVVAMGSKVVQTFLFGKSHVRLGAFERYLTLKSFKEQASQMTFLLSKNKHLKLNDLSAVLPEAVANDNGLAGFPEHIFNHFQSQPQWQ